MIPTATRTARATGAAPAAPAGGAPPRRGRGCGVVLLAALAGPPAAADTPVGVPSGQELALADILGDENPGELWLRFRFVAPGIARDGGTVSAQTAAADMEWLCRNLVLPYVAQHGLAPARIVISMADRPVIFGVSDPAATQFFEAYRPQDDTCIWEEY